ncbi:hypothetical protein ACGFIX_14430 [Nocardia salmonicida]|uniref:hypothetical protein n=1 Tax=Nocardia salmonicida TaxID=53431 RepID=UPI0037157F17
MLIPPRSLQVRVRTVAVIGTDPVDSHDVDLDTRCDSNGIPFVPKNRISARLRDAALTVLVGPDGGLEAVETAIALFGAAKATTSEGRLVHVGAAVWPEFAAHRVDAVLDAAARKYGRRAVLRRAITQALTVELGQTAIDDSGTPISGSLRFARGIRPGVVLRAPLRWQRTPTEAEVRFLAKTVLALRQIGHGASDSRGQVTCSLDGDFAATVALGYPNEVPADA